MTDKNFWDSDCNRNERDLLIEESVLELEKIVKKVESFGLKRNISVGTYVHSETNLIDELVLCKADPNVIIPSSILIEKCEENIYHKRISKPIKNVLIKKTNPITKSKYASEKEEYTSIIRKYKLNTYALKKIQDNLKHNLQSSTKPFRSSSNMVYDKYSEL